MRPVATDIARHEPQQKLSVRCRCQQQQQPTARMGLAMEACGCQTLHNKHQGQAGGQRPAARNTPPSSITEVSVGARHNAATKFRTLFAVWNSHGTKGVEPELN